MAIRLVLLRVDSSDWGHEEQVMGAAVRNQETPGRTHTVFVFLPNVLRTLGLHSDATWGGGAKSPALWVVCWPTRSFTLSLPGHPHRDEGLMGRQLRRSILLKRELRLDPVTAKALRSKLQT